MSSDSAAYCQECGSERGFFGPCPTCGADLSHEGTERTHPSRDIYEEEPCTNAGRTTEANGSEDTLATPTTASAGRSSTETAAGGTSATKTALGAKGTAESSSASGPSGSRRSAASLHPRHPFPEYAPHVDLIERLASERFFRYEVCPNGHVRQTPFPDERYPCSEFGCHRSVRAATRWFAETLRAAERGLTWIGDRL